MNLICARFYEFKLHNFLPPLAKVRNVRTFVIDLHTIEVSWDSSSRIAASVGYSIIGHRVYYSLLQSSGDESSITVHGGFTFAFIEDLRALTQYKIEVAILADYDGDMALGLRSDPVATTTYVNSTGFVIAPTNASIEESVDGMWHNNSGGGEIWRHKHSSNEFSIQGSTMTVYPGIHNDIQVCI